MSATFTCRAGADGSFTAEIVQSRGTTTATAHAYVPLTCTGAAQTVEAVGSVLDPETALRPGLAAASANLLQCDDFDCDSLSGAERIVLRPH